MSALAHAAVASAPLRLRRLGRCDYAPVYAAMQAYTRSRDAASADEFWAVEHPPVFTQGQAGRAEHLLLPGDIPVVQVDRGGQVTYHGPGQIVIYLLLDLHRNKLGVRALVSGIEAAIVAVLAELGVAGHARRDAPGVYLEDGAKIAALGLRVSRGRTYHGLSLNVAMDLAPFERINPCGMAGLPVTDLAACGVRADGADLTERLTAALCTALDLPGDRLERVDGLPSERL